MSWSWCCDEGFAGGVVGLDTTHSRSEVSEGDSAIFNHVMQCTFLRCCRLKEGAVLQ